MEDVTAETTARRWENFARQDAEFYITGHGETESDEQFLASGRAIAEPVVAYLGSDRLGGHLVEIGCGMGRITQAFAPHFTTVTALDIAPSMIAKAKALDPPPNIRYAPTNGSDLREVESASADVAFSFVVFQHVEEQAAIARMLIEVGRVLRPGGTAVLQFDTRPIGPALRAAFALPDAVVPATRRRGIRRHRREADWVRARLFDAGLGVEAERDRWLGDMTAPTSAFSLLHCPTCGLVADRHGGEFFRRAQVVFGRDERVLEPPRRVPGPVRCGSIPGIVPDIRPRRDHGASASRR